MKRIKRFSKTRGMGHVRLLFRLIPDSLIEYMLDLRVNTSTGPSGHLLDLRVICWAPKLCWVLGRLRPYVDARAA